MTITLSQFGIKSDVPFYENSQNVTSNYSTTASRNSMSVGPITINSGVTMTVTAGTVWTVI